MICVFEHPYHGRMQLTIFLYYKWNDLLSLSDLAWANKAYQRCYVPTGHFLLKLL